MVYPENPTLDDISIVVETGSGNVRVGKADPFEGPSVTLSNVVGEGAVDEAEVAKRGRRPYASYSCGEGLSSTDPQKNPVQRGVIQDWDAMEAVWGYGIHAALSHSVERRTKRPHVHFPLCFVIPPRWSKRDIERLTQIAFERFQAPAVGLVDSASASLWGVGQTAGCVYDFGAETIDVVPVMDSLPLRHLSQTIDVGGSDVDAYFAHLLAKEKGLKVSIEQARGLKENAGAVGVRPTADISSHLPTSDLLVSVNGSNVKLKDSLRHAAGNLLFNPPADFRPPGMGDVGVTAALRTMLDSFDLEKRLFMMESNVFVGLGSQLPGLRERMFSEITQLLPFSETGLSSTKEIKAAFIPQYLGPSVKERPEISTFIGASIASKILFTRREDHITLRDYIEYGPSIIHTRV